jgi:hypothetical protein
MQGGKNWFLPKEMNANRFFWDSPWLEIWSNHFYPSMGPNGGSVAMDSAHFIKSCIRQAVRQVVFTDDNELIVGRLDVDGQSFALIGLHKTDPASDRLLIKWHCIGSAGIFKL